MNFIKKLFLGKIDEDVHRQFTRFGKGKYYDRAIAELVVSRHLRVKTSFEYTNDLVKYLAETINEKVNIKGGIITTHNIKDELGFDVFDVKQFAGVKTFLIDTEISKDELLNVMAKFPDPIYCLSFDTYYGSLKVKVKSPKSAKPGKGEEEAKADYCNFITKNLSFKDEFVFDINKEFKKFRASHTFIIDKLIVPDEYKNDFVMARKMAKRKGKVIRELIIDGEKKIFDKEFLV